MSYVRNMYNKLYKRLFGNSINKIIGRINLVIHDISRYYASLDYSSLNKEERKYFEYSVLYPNYINRFSEFTVYSTSPSKIHICEEKRELYLDLLERQATLEEQVILLVNRWVIEKISYKINLNSYGYSSYEDTTFHNNNLYTLLCKRKTLELLYEIGASNMYIYTEFLEDYNKCYRESKCNPVNTMTHFKAHEESLELSVIENISIFILEKK